jgi:uncharacterized protein (DUF1684 family)
MKPSLFALIGFVGLSLFFSSCTSGQYRNEVEAWRSDHEADLRAEDGWLTLAGLFWLKTGVNTIGHGDAYDIELTDNFKQGKFGTIEFNDGKAVLTVEPGVHATFDGKSVTSLELQSDDPGPSTSVTTGSQTFYLIKRDNKFGLRLKDSDAAARRDFAGERWFPVDPSYRVIGTFEPFDSVQEVEVPNVLGTTFKMKSPGIVRFKLHGRDLSLQPLIEDEKTLFFIFKDTTSNNETYGAGRFLYTENPVNGEVVLDFNKAENPPCAFTEFATCPLPPAQNRLDLDIKAGEKKYDR